VACLGGLGGEVDSVCTDTEKPVEQTCSNDKDVIRRERLGVCVYVLVEEISVDAPAAQEPPAQIGSDLSDLNLER
jgi:hypothetical protein